MAMTPAERARRYREKRKLAGIEQTEEQRESARLSRLRYQEKMTEEQREQKRLKNKLYMRARWEQMTNEEKKQERQKQADRRRQHRKVNPERFREAARLHYEENAELICEQTRERSTRYVERISERNRLKYQADPEGVKRRVRQWQQANPNMKLANSRRYRARRRKASGDCSVEQAAARFAFYGNRCAYCGSTDRLHADHVIPLVRGGPHWPANIRPACHSCNSSKGDKLLSEWKHPQRARARS